MTDSLSDTPAHIERILVEGYRAMSPAQKLERVAALNRALDQLAAARIRAQRGSKLTDRELVLRMASLHLEAQTMRTVFDWDPDVMGF